MVNNLDKDWKKIKNIFDGIGDKVKNVIRETQEKYKAEKEKLKEAIANYKKMEKKLETEYALKTRQLKEEYALKEEELKRNITPIQVDGEEVIKVGLKMNYEKKLNGYNLFFISGKKLDSLSSEGLNSWFYEGIGVQNIMKDFILFYKNEKNQDKEFILTFVPVNKLEKDVQD